MRKAVITVSKDKCPLDILAEMGNTIENSWVFLHQNAIEKLQKSDGVSSKEGRTPGTLELFWEATDDFPATRVVIELNRFPAEWKPILLISASDIAFTLMPVDPEFIYFLKMAE